MDDLIPWAGYVGNHTGAAAFESMVGMSVRLRFGGIFTEVENCRKREEVVEEVDVSSKNQQQQPEKSAAAAADRSTGPVDRRAQHAQRSSGRPAQSTAEGERSTARSTD